MCVQDCIPAATAQLLHELHPDLAAVALSPQSAGAAAPAPAAAAAPAAPPAAEGGEMVSVPRGYLDYLESLVSRCVPGVAAADGEAAAEGAAAAGGAGDVARVASIAPATVQVLMQSNK